MKVLFVARMLAEYGGAERQLLVLARGLVQRGHEVGVAVLYRGGLLESEFGRNGIEIFDLGKSGRFAIVGSVRALRRLIRLTRPDIVHGYLGLPNLLVLAARGARRSAAVVAGLRASDIHLEHYDWLHRLLLQAERRSIRWHDLCIVNSSVGERHFRRYAPDARLLHIPNGIDTERFRPDAGRRERARASWDIGPATRVIGCVARLDPMKDHETLLPAFAQVLQGAPNTHLVCYGAGGDVNLRRLRALAARLGIEASVSWYPPAPDLENWYPGFDLHCTSSAFGEGFPNVVGEAMACGVPCVVTDVGDAADVVGDTGWTAHPRAPRELAKAMEHALMAVGPEAARVSRERIVRLFSVDMLLARTEAALQELCDKHQAGQEPANDRDRA